MSIDLPLIPAYLRVGALFGDSTADDDRNPDVEWADEGEAWLEPTVKKLAVEDEDGRVAVLTNSTKVGTIHEGGRIAWSHDAAADDNNIIVVDLTDESLEDRVSNPDGRTHILTLRNVKSKGMMLFERSEFDVRIAADKLDASGVVNIGRQFPAQAIGSVVVDLRKGDTGTSVTGIDPEAAAEGELVFLLGDGTPTDPVPLPPGPPGGVNRVAGRQGDISGQQLVDAIDAPLQAWAEDVAALQLAGVEVAYAESYVATSTSRIYDPTNEALVPGLSVSVVGTGRPVDIEFYAAGVWNSQQYADVVACILVNGSTVGGTAANVNSVFADHGPPVVVKRRAVLDAGVTYTFSAAIMCTYQGGTANIQGNEYGRNYLSVVSR